MPQSLLIISRQSPWSGPSAREALDIALAGGAFDLPVGMLFLDDGVLQLASAQDASQLQQKDLTANLQALSVFGVDDLFACTASLAERGMLPSALSVEPLQVLSDQEMAAVIDRYDQVITI
jgi:tRNA 2-thiouridine synthesizing protein C